MKKLRVNVRSASADQVRSALRARGDLREHCPVPVFNWEIEVVDGPSRGLVFGGHNIVTNTGGRDLLKGWFLNTSALVTAWYVMLKGAGSVAAADTMSSHSGWSEVTSYDEAARQAWTGVSTGTGTADNSASKAVFTISSTVTVAGAGLTSVATKGGTSGTLYSVADFSASRTLYDNDVLNVTGSLSWSDDGA